MLPVKYLLHRYAHLLQAYYPHYCLAKFLMVDIKRVPQSSRECSLKYSLKLTLYAHAQLKPDAYPDWSDVGNYRHNES